MSLSALWSFLAVALPVLAALAAPMSTVDLTYHLRAGDEILRTGAVPTVDTWSYTAAGQPWVDQQWGAQLLLAITERIGGWTGLVLLRAAITGLIVWAIRGVARERGVDPRIAALLAVAAFVVAAPSMALRPQLFGMVCFALALLLVARRQRHPRRLWLVPVLVAVWANLHGSFVLGPLLVGLAWLDDRFERRPGAGQVLLVAVASTFAACLTPSGPWVWVYAIGLSMNPEVTARITEWQPTSLRDATGLLFYGSALAVTAVIARRGQSVSWPSLLWLGVFFLIGAYAQRGVAWWPPVAVLIVAGLLPSRAAPPIERTGLRRINLAIAVACIAVAVGLLPAWRPVDRATRVPVGVLRDAPAGIAAALSELAGPGERVFNPQRWGSWLGYAVPDIRIAIDSRIELYSPAVWTEYEQILAGLDGWEARLRDQAVRLVVADRSQTAFVGRLKGRGWRVVYEDGDGAILQRE